MFNKTITLPLVSHAETALKNMRPSERWAFYILSIILILSTFMMVRYLYVMITVPMPQPGGKITEGVIGAPRFVNPVLAISQTDKDLSELIYASLMTKDTDGNLVPELAQNYHISDDALTYTFTLHDNLVFHDGTPLTIDDVIFTIEKTTQPDIKSPERANWEGVNIEKVDDLTVKFTLTKPYAQFLQNTILGILPEEHWGTLTSDEFIFSKLNTSPIGSGAYEFVSAVHDTSGIPHKFNLTRFTDYVRGTPYIKKMTINFYPGEEKVKDALINGDVDSMSEASPADIPDLLSVRKSTVLTSTLPRVFAIFFNQAHNDALASETVRDILNNTIDQEGIITEVLGGYAQSIDSTILTSASSPKHKELLSTEAAQEKLEDAGWERDPEDGIYYKGDIPLSITLTTANSLELKEVATVVVNTWQAIGVQVKLEVFEPGNLTQSVLRTREYDALLFGEIIGTDPDLYAFWHSSQRNDPGLNIANYANSHVDTLLVKARKTIAPVERAEIYREVATEINKDTPAIFLYAPNYIYITQANVRGIQLTESMEPHERFTNIHLWHINTARLWHFLRK